MPLHWWYEAEVDESDFQVLERLGRPYYTCPAAVGWNNFINHYERSMINIDKMISYGEEHDATGVLITDWGDFGHINHLSSSIPMYIYGALKAQGGDLSQDWYKDLMTKDYYELLIDAGNERTITFETLMKWYYDYFNDDDAYGNIQETIDQISIKDLEDSICNLRNCLERLDKVQIGPMSSLIVSIGELTNNLEGQLWMNRFFLYLKEPSKDTATQLINTIKAWFVIYSKIWNRYNRPSELFRVEETLNNICVYLEVQK